jgi:hypothetical protein
MSTRPAADEFEALADADPDASDMGGIPQPATTRRTATIEADRRAGKRRTFTGSFQVQRT